MQYTNQKSADTLEIRVYKGESAEFALYEDEGDNYQYEKGKYTLISFNWDENKQVLTIGNLKGSYPGYLKKRIFKVVFVSKIYASKNAYHDEEKMILYKGQSMPVKAN